MPGDIGLLHASGNRLYSVSNVWMDCLTFLFGCLQQLLQGHCQVDHVNCIVLPDCQRLKGCDLLSLA